MRVISGRGAAGKEFSIRTDRDSVVQVRGVENPDTEIGASIARMSGVTFGALHIVSRMLLPAEVPGRMLCAALAPRLVAPEELEGDSCLAVELGEEWPGHKLFIRIGDYALRRVTSQHEVTEQLRAAARARNIDLSALHPWTQVLTYEPQVYADDSAQVELDW
jgi:hypothetical protein